MVSEAVTSRRHYGPLRRRSGAICVFTLLLSAVVGCSDGAAAEPWQSSYLVGVNLAGAGFGAERIAKDGARGRHGVNYVYPVEPLAPGYKSPNYFVAKGMNTFRLSFLWERLQPKLGQELDAAETARLLLATDELLKLGTWVILDLHNYARYDGTLIGSSGVSVADFSDVWRRIASLFKDKDHVLLGLMNEPHDMSTDTWVEAANGAIAAIRAAGATNLILVPGNHWSSAQAWYDNFYGTPNAKALLGIADPLDKVVFEAHTYFDSDSSGTNARCVSATIGVERLQPFTRWLTEHKKLGFIGEFGAGTDPICLEALSAMTRSMQARPDVYLGWTYWAAGPWWPRDYFTLIEPRSGDAPQMAALLPYLQLTTPTMRRAP
jgi:endoglucanase